MSLNNPDRWVWYAFDFYEDSLSYDSKDVISCITHYARLGVIGFYALIKHDKDLELDGSIKKSHYHAVLHYTYQKAPKTVQSDLHLDGLPIERFEKVKSIPGSLRYLLHLDETEKGSGSYDPLYHRYDINEIITNDLEFYQKKCKVVDKFYELEKYEIFQTLATYIVSCPEYLTLFDLMQYCYGEGDTFFKVFCDKQFDSKIQSILKESNKLKGNKLINKVH